MGTIHKRNRKANPYQAKLPKTKINGESIRPILGSFPTYEAADKALFTAINQGQFDKFNMTLKDLWDIFKSGEYYNRLSKDGQGSHRSSWKHLEPKASVKVRELNKEIFQSVVRDMTHIKKVCIAERVDGTKLYEEVEVPHKRAAKLKVRNLSSLLCKEAMGLGLIHINFGQLVELPPNDTEETPSFPPSVLKTLWDHRTHKEAQIILSWCFTGTRPNELFLLNVEDYHLGPPDYCIGGSKTDAGRNRIIPVPLSSNLFLMLPKVTEAQGPYS